MISGNEGECPSACVVEFGSLFLAIRALGLKFKISLFRHKADNMPVSAERTWSEICRKILRPPIRADKDGALWSPATFDPPQRLLENVREVSLLVLDYDHHADFKRDLQPWRSYAFAAHTTFNHSESEQRFRLIIPLRDPIQAAQFPRLWKWASQVSGAKIDSAASDASRMFYVPVRRSETAPYLFEIFDGEFLDWRALDLTQAEKPPEASPAPANGSSHHLDELLRKAFAARNGAETFRLFECDTSLFGGDESRADHSLATRFAFWARDTTTLEQMLMRSRLVREKWTERHYGNGNTYLQGLVQKAIAGCSEFYSGNGHSDSVLEGRLICPDPEKQKSPSGFNFTELDDLLAEPEEQKSYVWDKTLPCGGFSIVAAKPKVGKSTFARGLAVAVSRGAPFFGRSTLKGKVICLVLEEKRREVAAHFRRMGASGDGIIIHTGPTPKDALTALELAIEEHSPRLVIIDPLSRFVRVVDFNSYGEATRQLEPLIDLARLSDCQPHIMALHHNGKGGDLRESGDALLGSTGFFGAVDTLLTMHKRERARTVESIQRYGEDLPETILHLDPETGLVDAAGDMKNFLLEERKSAILESIGSDPVDEKAIKELTGGTNKGLTSKAVRSLFEARRLSRTGSGKKGDPFLYQIVGQHAGLSPVLGVTDPQFSEYQKSETNLGKNSGFVGPTISADPEKQKVENRVLPDEVYFPPGCDIDEVLERQAIENENSF